VEFNGRIDPKLRFTVSMLDMHVRTRFFSREEVEAEASDAEDCRAHAYRIPESPGGQTCRVLIRVPAVYPNRSTPSGGRRLVCVVG
jgi:hypothetical protein